MSTPPSKFFNRYEFDEDVRDERDRLRAVNGQLLAALRGFVGFVEGGYGWATRGYTMKTLEILAKEARAAIAEAQKATGTQP